MASSVAKLKPLSSVIAEPDEVLVQNMEENEVLAGLARNSDSARKADILDELRANARRNGGRLQFDDRLGLFRVLQEALADIDSNTRLRCTEFLCEIIPEFGEDLDNCMTFVLPQLVSNIGDNQVSVKKSAIQTLHVYMKHSSQVSAVLNAIIDHGLESENRRTRTESLVALPILIMPNLAHEDLFTLTKALVGRLENSSRPETSTAVISLERIKNVVGSPIFDSYLNRLSPDQQNLCTMALQNRNADPVKDLELLGGRKAKSAGHLNSNGIIADVERPERGTVLDRGHTIAISNTTDDFLDANYGPLEFGFVPLPVMSKLRDQSNWRVRAQGIEELKTLMGQLTNTEPIHPNLGPLFALLLGFLDDVNFKIGVTSLQIIGLLVAKLGVGVRPVLKPLLSALSNKLGDNKIVIRQENMKVLMQLMQILSPKAVLSVLTSNLQHRNSRVREETVNVFIAALLTFPSSDFNLPELTNAIAPALVDSKRRVRQAALEAFAVIAQAMGPGRIQPVVSAVDAIELTMGGDGVMAAITARLARRQLPRLNRDGLVEYAVPMPSSGTIRGQNNTPRGADIDWILAGTAGTGSADPSGSARSTPGLNDSLNMSGPSPRRFFSAGKNRLPWEGEQARDGNQPVTDNVEPMRPPMKLNSWAPTEIVNDRAVKSTPQSRTASLSTPTKSKLTTSSYAEKYQAMSMQRANQASDRHASKATENTPGSSYAEMHRAKVKKDKSKIGSPTAGLNQTVPPGSGSSVNSYALLYKRGTITTKAKASSSAEPAIGEQTPKEIVPRGAQSVTPTPFSLQSSFSPGEEEMFPTSQRKAFPMSLSSSWPDWTEMRSEMKPFGRLSPVSHTVPADMDTLADQMDSEPKKSDVPQTPIHMKPQLARSASKTRGIRAPELGEPKKGEIQSSVMDYLDMTPTRPTQLAPVKAGNIPPQDSLGQVHKQAELKRALKMYSVISDGEDGRSRTPSPSDNNNDPPYAPMFENNARLSKLPTKPESPFDSKPRIARTPLHSRRLSAETPLPLQSPTPLPNKSDLENPGLGVTGHGLLATKGGRATENSPIANGMHYDDDKHSKTSGMGSSISGNEDLLGMQRVEVVGQGLLRLDKQHNAEDEGNGQLQYETEESDEGMEDDDEEDIEDDDEEEEEEDEEEEELGGEEEGEEESGSESEEEEYPTVSDSQDADISAATTTTLTTTESSTFKSEESSDSLEDSDEDSDSGIRGNTENLRDMTPKTMRKSLSKSTRERMERRRQEEEEKLQREQEFERERSKQAQIQREEEQRLRQKIMKEQLELGKMLDRKEKERELERQKQQQLQEELQKQEKALRDRLLKQQEELEEIEQEKQREKMRQKERMKERMRQKQKQKEAELLRAEAERKEKEREQEEELRRKLAEKEVELKKKQLQRAKENSAGSENSDLSVTGSSSPLKSNRKPPTGGTPKKKTPLSSAQSERDSSYAVTDDPSEIRRNYAASAGSTASQCWEVSLEDLQPFNNPDSALREALKYLANTEDWEMKCEGIQGIRRLTKHHPEVLVSQLHTVTLAVIAEVKNLRSQVSRSGICCLGDMYATLGKHMDNELEVTTKILLAKGGESSGFIRDDVEKSLTAMVCSLTPTRVLVALISGGASHRNVAVRKTTAQFLSLLAERMGASRLMSGAKDVTEKILPTAAQFVTDGGPETRYYGRKILHIVYDHPEFDKLVSKHVPSNLLKDVRDTVENLRTKGLGDPPSDPSSARQRKPASGGGGSRSGGVRGSVALSPSSNASSRESSRSGKPVARDGLVQGEEVIPNLVNSLQANDWKERQQAVDQFVDLVQLNPDGLGPKFTKVFDAFIPRLKDSNSKVNLHALQCLPKILPCLANQSGALIPPVVAALTSNFASKNTNVFSTAEEALDELIKYIDNTFLVQPFCTTAQYGSSRVKPIMVDKLADIVPTVHARKPQIISRHVLPLLWSLLNASNGSAGAGNSALKTSTSRLTTTLYSCMGRSLTEQASSQVPRIQEKIHQIIGS
ncbi:hypothetical protein ACROYT_G039583 [Oculina patagonica]